VPYRLVREFEKDDFQYTGNIRSNENRPADVLPFMKESSFPNGDPIQWKDPAQEEGMPAITSVKGTRSFYPPEMGFRTWLYERVRDVSRKYGYQEFDGPFLETMDLYTAKSGEELVKEQAFVFQDRGGEQVALRPELTPTLARMVAERINQLPVPIRWWSFGPFWRYERPQKGRAREFFQWNIDLLGVDNPMADAELVAIAATFFQAVGLVPGEVKIQFNNRRLMDSALTAMGLNEEISRGMVFRLIDKKEKMNQAAWEQYARENGLEARQIRGIVDLLENRELWKQSSELTELFAAAEMLGVGAYLEYNPAIVRGLDYYTGTVFEARDAADEFRAILGGGRYDNLVADVGGGKIPGVGFAMGDVVIGLVLAKYGKSPDIKTVPADVLVTTFSKEEASASLQVIKDLRESGLAAEWYPAPDRLPKQLKYADALGIRYAIIIGPDEIRQGTATIKDLLKREQTTVARVAIVEEMSKRLVVSSTG
jgi:histidyl-tRNA synthetase